MKWLLLGLIGIQVAKADMLMDLMMNHWEYQYYKKEEVIVEPQFEPEIEPELISIEFNYLCKWCGITIVPDPYADSHIIDSDGYEEESF